MNDRTPLRANGLQTRVIAGVAILILVAAVISDRVANGFWIRNAFLASLVSSLVVVGLSVAVVNEVLERRRRRRWSVLAQYVLLELVRTARLTWTALLELLGLMYAGEETPATLSAGSRTLLDTPRIVAAMRELLADPDRRRQLHGLIERLMDRSDEVLGRWAGVMLNSAAYAETIDRHVELYSRLAWVGSLLEYFEPTDDDPRRRRLSRSSPAVQLQGDFDDDWLSDNLVAIAQLAEALDQDSLKLALHIVPREWWAERWQSPTVDAPDESPVPTPQRE
ncbi:MAG TPA: hypothetical protein VNR66_13845 [Solirubrobacteraceae bacterium]|nr:hypothetical protein [Solirubrobacteraceae bacterium]